MSTFEQSGFNLILVFIDTQIVTILDGSWNFETCKLFAFVNYNKILTKS